MSDARTVTGVEGDSATGSPAANDPHGERQRFVLDDTGFDEVPKKYRRFYRKWKGPGDQLAPNEVICPVCKVVIRSSRTLLPGDRVVISPAAELRSTSAVPESVVLALVRVRFLSDTFEVLINSMPRCEMF